MTNEQRQQFRDQVLTVFRQLGGRATANEVWAHLRALAGEDQLTGWLDKGAMADIRSVLRSKDPDTGLPVAPHVGDQYVQADLLSLAEYAYLIVDHQQRADEHQLRVRGYQKACEEHHGVWLDVAAAQEILDAEDAG
jgi:hypothetical protein